MSFIDEDDDGFNVSQFKNSKLSTLFSSTFVEDEATNQTLKYVPPKQPKTIEIPSDSNSNKESRTQQVIHAIPVNAYKFESQQYRAVGCVGCALIASNVHNFKLILYTGKQQHICYATINYDFVFTVQANKYCTFYDDKRENWSLNFSDDKSLIELARKIAFCKAQSLSSPKLICQDIRVESSDGNQVEANDLLELKYKVWTVEELDKLGTLFDSSESTDNKRPFRIKLSNKGKVWQDMLIGMKAASQRFCLVPIELKDDFVGIIEKAVLYETTVMLAFELDLIRIKPRETKDHTTRQRANTSTSVHSQEGDKRSDSVSSICAEDNVEHSKKSSKSDILSRVAKVGTQIMIPKKSKSVEEDKVAEVTEVIEATETKETSTEEVTKVKPLPKPRTNSLHNINVTEVPTIVSVPQPLYTAPTSTSTIQPTTFVPYAFNPLVNDNSVNRIMSEMNSNYSELRLNLSKITDKLESVVSKVDGLQSINKIFSSATTIGMDSTLLLASIQRIVNDNNTLKSEVDEKNAKLDKLNEKICELLSHQFKEHREDKYADLNSANKRLQEDLQKCLQEKEYVHHEKEVVEKENELLKKDKQTLIKEKDEILSQIERLKSELEKKNTPVHTVSNKDVETRIKKIMNVLYRTVAANVEKSEEDSMKKDEIVELLANAIRVVTLEALGISEMSNSPQRSPFHNNKSQASSQEVVVENERTQTNDEKLVKDECAETSLEAEKEVKSENEELETESENKSNVELSNSSNEFSEILKWKPKPPSPPVFNFSDEDDEDKWLK